MRGTLPAMSALTLLRTIAAPIVADADWAADPALIPDPSFALRVEPLTQAAIFAFRALDVNGNEVSLAAMELDFAVVAKLAHDDKAKFPSGGVAKDMYRELATISAGTLITAKKLGIEVDLPFHATLLFPRMRGAPTNPAAGMTSLQVLGGIWR